jgi:uncharacterized OsmC-like protein
MASVPLTPATFEPPVTRDGITRAQMSNVTVWHVDGDRFAVEARDHVLMVDQPLAAGGDDTAPTPTELFVASLASCVAFYARRYLARHALPTTGLRVTGAYDMAQHPARVGSISLEITLPEGVPENQRDRLLAVASHCTVHNSLITPPQVMIALRRSGHHSLMSFARARPPRTRGTETP